jgi:hypothetical protein
LGYGVSYFFLSGKYLFYVPTFSRPEGETSSQHRKNRVCALQNKKWEHAFPENWTIISGIIFPEEIWLYLYI